jgi:hypothetical protein
MKFILEYFERERGGTIGRERTARIEAPTKELVPLVATKEGHRIGKLKRVYEEKQ